MLSYNFWTFFIRCWRFNAERSNIIFSLTRLFIYPLLFCWERARCTTQASLRLHTRWVETKMFLFTAFRQKETVVARGNFFFNSLITYYVLWTTNWIQIAIVIVITLAFLSPNKKLTCINDPRAHLNLQSTETVSTVMDFRDYLLHDYYIPRVPFMLQHLVRTLHNRMLPYFNAGNTNPVELTFVKRNASKLWPLALS